LATLKSVATPSLITAASTLSFIVECLARAKICFGWTFDDHDGIKGICTLKGAGICCNQNSKMVKKKGAISGFVCDNCNKACTSCWSISGACPCRQEVERFDPNFAAGGTRPTAYSASVSLRIYKFVQLIPLIEINLCSCI